MEHVWQQEGLWLQVGFAQLHLPGWIFLTETSPCAQRSGGFSVGDVAADVPQPCSGAGFVGEVAGALLDRKVGKRIAVVL